MTDRDLGTATIVYEHPEEGTVETTVQNEHVAYFQDHWILKRDEDESGNDQVRRIPVERVHYVDRSVEAFEDEVSTLRNQVESFADDLRSRLLGDDDGEGRTTTRSKSESGPVEIDVEDDTDDDSA